ncbi:helix-turn-helix domain-containing protein [Nitrogeniibacter aestuarii]|uniref:helix-turn-helix domain-containing protein n=1 Tax=Nitrogeniibacter aestuarii TaxID=2815343 RepID=UPI001E45F9B8|nr:helix-turn-helix domain-containing protein [Nitrogeniibacter aestuarii]
MAWQYLLTALRLFNRRRQRPASRALPAGDLLRRLGLHDAPQHAAHGPHAPADARHSTTGRAPPAPRTPVSKTDAEATLRAQMIETLRRNQWQVKKSAEELGMSRATFYRKLDKLQIVPPNRRDGW